MAEEVPHRLEGGFRVGLSHFACVLFFHHLECGPHVTLCIRENGANFCTLPPHKFGNPGSSLPFFRT